MSPKSYGGGGVPQRSTGQPSSGPVSRARKNDAFLAFGHGHVQVPRGACERGGKCSSCEQSVGYIVCNCVSEGCPEWKTPNKTTFRRALGPNSVQNRSALDDTSLFNVIWMR